jgi:hypothetical protein
MVGPGRCWPLPEDGWPAMPFLHRERNTVVKDQVMTTMLYAEPLKDGRSRRDIGRNLNATIAQGPETAATSRKQEAFQ